MMKNYFLAIMLLLYHGTGMAQSRPNIILILSDDMGYSDLGCYGGEAATPHLDQLAKEGLRYTQCYNMARCCPTRAALLTGLYPHQAGMGWMTSEDFQLPGYRGDLNHTSVTIAEALKQNGYATYMTGKWHLNHKPAASKDNWPLQRGFDKYYGILLGAANYYDPGLLVRDNTQISPATDTAYTSNSYYFTDAISDNSVQYLKTRDRSKPFFMYVAYTAAHWPMQAPEAAIAKYKGRFNKGWQQLRTERFERMKKLGVIDANAVLSPDDGKPWADEEDKPAMLRRMETYAAMIDIMDQGIGRLVSELKAQGIYDNTIILFLQDNGACAEQIGNGATRPVAQDPDKIKQLANRTFTQGINPPITRDGQLVMQGHGVMAGPINTYVAYLKEWAHLSNTPFRMYKHYTQEGGISTPLIVHWPAGIKEKGGIRKQPVHIIDVLPTLLAVTGTAYPHQYHGNTITPVSGVDLTPTFTGQPLARKAIFWDHEMNRGVRMGKWKLVCQADLDEREKTYTLGPWELYDIDHDRSELHNLAAQYPDLVKEMSALWEAHASKTNVYPSPWTKKE